MFTEIVRIRWTVPIISSQINQSLLYHFTAERIIYDYPLVLQILVTRVGRNTVSIAQNTDVWPKNNDISACSIKVKILYKSIADP